MSEEVQPGGPERIPFGERLTCSIDDATKVSGLSRSMIYNKMKSGEIEWVKIGARRLIKVSSLLRLLGNDDASEKSSDRRHQGHPPKPGSNACCIAARTRMPNRKHIDGLHAARAADEFARREPSSAQEEGKEVVALTAAPAIGAKKGPPRLRKASSRDDAMVTPTIGLEEHKAALRQVFGETLSDEFVDVMLTKLVSVLRPGRLEVLDETTLNAAIALIASVQPRSELQAVIAVQIAATTFAGLKFLQSGQHHLEEAYIRIDGGVATRLLRLKLELIHALDKHRRDNKQTVRVEHVHIHAGAHAVLGIVNSSKQKDGGVEEISGLHPARAADEFAFREPVKWVSSPEEEGKQVVALTPDPAIGAKKAPPRLRKPSSNNDAVAPTTGVEEHKAALRQVFGEPHRTVCGSFGASRGPA